MTTQQQRLQTGAVDEQVARKQPVLARLQPGDVAVFMCVHRDHVASHVVHAQFSGGVAAQEGAELAGVQVVAVIGDPREFRRAELLGRPAVRAQVRLVAHQVGEGQLRVGRAPVRRQVGFAVAVRCGEGVEIAVRVDAVDPAVEARALLERGVALAHEVGLGHADPVQGVAHARPGALAHADRRDLGGLQQGHAQARVFGCNDGGGQPSGRAATDDHDVFDLATVHDLASVARADPCG
jgi:hypothetical protein